VPGEDEHRRGAERRGHGRVGARQVGRQQPRLPPRGGEVARPAAREPRGLGVVRPRRRRVAEDERRLAQRRLAPVARGAVLRRLPRVQAQRAHFGSDLPRVAEVAGEAGDRRGVDAGVERVVRRAPPPRLLPRAFV